MAALGHGRLDGSPEWPVRLKSGRLPYYQVGGPVPRPIYRFLPEEKFADDFTRGIIRISTFKACREHEDPLRRDDGEGTQTYLTGTISGDSSDPKVALVLRRMGTVVAPGVQVSIENSRATQRVEEAYVLCFTESPKAEGFGRYGIEIADPVLFFRRFTAALLRQRAVSPRAAMSVGRVHYGSREYTNDSLMRVPAPFVKSPERYAREREVRMVWHSPYPIEPHLVRCPEIVGTCRRIA